MWLYSFTQHPANAAGSCKDSVSGGTEYIQISKRSRESKT